MILGILTAPSLPARERSVPPGMQFVQISQDRGRFILAADRSPFIPWGVNYDHDERGRLLEDYWGREWFKVEEDFGEMKSLGANVVRIHLQLGRFMRQAAEPNDVALDRLARLLALAQQHRLYLDVTGLACYHKQDIPAWYDTLSEQARWDVQAHFWEAVAALCADSPAVFCYDLMNEPIVPGAKKETEWLTGELGGKYFVQRITLDLAGRTQRQVAKAWVDRLVAAIRKHDRRHLITVGVIPWVQVFPKAKPLFYAEDVAENLDFASVHFYPEAGKVGQALTALAAYDIGKPLVIEEMFPLKCSAEELEIFIDCSRRIAEGWIGFYWGKTPEEYRPSNELADVLTLRWLELFARKAGEIQQSATPEATEPSLP